MKLPLIFKSSFMKDNRSAMEHFHGPGLEKGLALLAKIRETFELPIITDVHFPEQVPAVAEVADATDAPFKPLYDWRLPIKEKVDLLMEVNNAALDNGANFITSVLFQVNEQKFFASTDGSYIDQDVHRLWAPFFATAIGPAPSAKRPSGSLRRQRSIRRRFMDSILKSRETV